jgi:hypothetical protein
MGRWFRLGASLAFASCAVGFVPAASAATLNLTTSWYADASGTAQLGAGTTGNTTAVSATNGYSYGQQVQDVSSHAFTSSASGKYGFDDAYLFTLSGPASANSVTATINLGSLLSISNLEVRLFTYSGGVPVGLSGDTGLPAGGGATIVTGWKSAPSSGTGWVSIFNDTNLNPGNYVFEVRGLASGSAGGTYAGALQVGPVPLPPGLALFLSGLGVCGSFAYRRAASFVSSVVHG